MICVQGLYQTCILFFFYVSGALCDLYLILFFCIRGRYIEHSTIKQFYALNICVVQNWDLQALYDISIMARAFIGALLLIYILFFFFYSGVLLDLYLILFLCIRGSIRLVSYSFSMYPGGDTQNILPSSNFML